MIEVEAESISNFGLLAGSQVQPNEQIFVLSSCQLQDVILQVTAPLLKRLDTLEVELQKHIKNDELELENTATNITLLWKATFGSKKAGKLLQLRTDKINKYMEALRQAGNGKAPPRATFDILRGVLKDKDGRGLRKELLSPTIKTLMKMYPGKYSITYDHPRDKRKGSLIMNPRIPG